MNESIDPLTRHDLVALLMLAAAAVLLVQARTRRQPSGTRWAGILVVPVLGAIALAVLTAAFHGDRLDDLFGVLIWTPLGAAVFIGSLLIALALIDLGFARVLPLLIRLLHRFGLPARVAGDRAMTALLAGVLAVSAGLSAAQQPATGNLVVSDPVESMVAFDLPGAPMGIALDGPQSGYLSLIRGSRGEGSIVRFELPVGGDTQLRLRVVAEGLRHPRGIAILGGDLYVAELGDLPCRPSFPQCTGWDLPGLSPPEAEREIIDTARGRVTAHPIREDGSLGAPRPVIADLPVVGTEHGVNGMTTGPDGYIYVTLGNVDQLWREPDGLHDLTPHPELLGTILRFDALGEIDIYARGLRNVYQVTFDAEGALWAVDNDGPTLGGWRGEEVLQIKEDHHYGYPHDGTFLPNSTRNDHPIWLIGQLGSAGVAWWESSPDPGLIIGSCGMLTHLELAEVGERLAPFSEWGDGAPGPSPLLSAIPGCVSAVAVADADHALVTVFNYQADGLLYLVRLR